MNTEPTDSALARTKFSAYYRTKFRIACRAADDAHSAFRAARNAALSANHADAAWKAYRSAWEAYRSAVAAWCDANEALDELNAAKSAEQP